MSRYPAVLLSAILFATLTAPAATFVVTNTGSTGGGTLIRAIQLSETNANADVVQFNIPLTDPGHRYYRDDNIPGSLSLVASTTLPDGSITDFDPDYVGTPYSWYRISQPMGSPLPPMNFTVTIDGSTQPGYNGRPLIELEGATGVTNGNGLVFNGTASIVRGLAINGHTYVAGTNAPSRGIWLRGGNCVVQGCFLGTDITGTKPLGNFVGIEVNSNTNRIGGITPGAGNIISGNGIGVKISGGAIANAIQGNSIGVDFTGSRAISNNIGVQLTSINTRFTAIGGVSPLARNIISGNANDNILIETGVANTTIQNNLIGPDASGQFALSPGARGVTIDGHDNNVGEFVLGGGNVISGNRDGVVIGLNTPSQATNNNVRGNLVGPYLVETNAVGNSRYGILVFGRGTTIGGGLFTTNRLNVISGNGVGIVLDTTNAQANLIAGNILGLDANLGNPLPNAGDGIRIQNGASGNSIGGPFVNDNIIAYNASNGIAVSIDSFDNTIMRNAIFQNGRLGIDIGDDGVTTTGTPVLFGAVYGSDTTVINGLLSALPNTEYRLDFYSNAQPDDSGFGEGEHYFYNVFVTTDNTGFVPISISAGETIPNGAFVTATATRSPSPGVYAETSEFSVAVRVFIYVTNTNDTGPGSLQQAVTDANANSGFDTIFFAVSGTIVLDGELFVNDPVNLVGLGADQLTISAAGMSRVFFLQADTILSGLTIADGFLDYDDGAGLYVDNFRAVHIQDCTFVNNHAISGGFGGAIKNHGYLTVSGSTFSANSATFGGAIYSSGSAFLDARNCTFSANSADEQGGGLHLQSGVILNCTITDNRSLANAPSGSGGGIYENPNPFSVFLHNTIVAKNYRGTNTTADDIKGEIDSSSLFNLIGDGSNLVGLTNGVNGNRVGGTGLPPSSPIDPLLGPLQNNGGPTLTHLPLPGSPAIDGGTNSVAPGFDQRGISRPQGPIVDIGAVELVLTSLEVTTTADDGVGSLRQALADADASPAPQTISFNIPGSGPHVIQLLSDLPPIAEPVNIDARTQPGYRSVPLVVLRGAYGIEDGLIISTSNSLVAGLVINSFDAAGIRICGPESSGNRIIGNYIGTGPTGTNAQPNSEGIVIEDCAHDNFIGGTDPDTGNLISGNGSSGIVIDGDLCQRNLIQGNRIGTDVSGNVAVPNLGLGIYVYGISNVIGGSAPTARNIISGNAAAGILVDFISTDNLIEGNSIGLAANGSPLGNGEQGIAVGSGFSQGGGTGGQFGDPTGTAIRGNSIFGNGLLGIDLGSDNVTPNDAGDFDFGANNLQNFPVLIFAINNGDSLRVRGTLNSRTNLIYAVEFFASSTNDPSGFGEGQQFLGSSSVATDGTGNSGFEVTLPASVPLGYFITATATDPANNTSEFSRAVPANGPSAPVITAQPVGTNAAPSANVMFCVTAIGTPPLTYQWRHNGVNIPGQTNTCFNIPAAALTEGGSFTVVVGNEYGAVTSDPALLTFNVPATPPGDNFVNRVPLNGSSGTAVSTNNFATFEPGEPRHAGKPGGKSVWYTWRAPATGIATFRTTGSSFDTLLAIYTGSIVSNLTVKASDEDSGDFLTSYLQFNAVAGTDYPIAIDGFGGEAGTFVLIWSLESTLDTIPVIISQPKSQTVGPGSNWTFTVVAIGNALTYRWSFNGVTISGATAASYTVTNVQDSKLGQYVVRVSSGERFVDSIPASLQINLTGQEVQPVLTMDKFLDAVNSGQPLRLGGPAVPGGGGGSVEGGGDAGGGALSRGYTGTQVFDTFGSKSQAGEPHHCDVVGGASQWFTYQADEAGLLYLNTDGSSFDTILAVYTGDGTSFTNLQSIACDNDSGIDHLDSSLAAPVQTGIIYFIAVDGVAGVTGSLQLNFSLVTSSTLTSLGLDTQGRYQLRVVGRANMKFTVQSSSNLALWTDVMTVTSSTPTFDFTDPTPRTEAPRFYRVLMLP